MNRISLLLNFALIIIFSNNETLSPQLPNAARTLAIGCVGCIVLLTAIFVHPADATIATNGAHTSSAHRLLDASTLKAPSADPL